MSGTLSAGTVSIGVKSDSKGFGANLHKHLMGEVGGIGKILGGTVMAGFGAAMAGIGAVVGVGMKEAMGAEKLNAQFTAGIKSTGNAANLSVKGMDDLAASIAGYSGQSYESIGSTEKLLQTFRNIKNVGPNKIFDQATVAAADMAAKMGGDASGTAIKLGRALADPVKGVMALTRVGVVFTQAQKDSIKAMVKHGDTMGAQKAILKELNTEFGGAAKAAGQTLPGQLARAHVAFGELSKGVMEGVLPVLTPLIEKVAAGFTKAAPMIKKFGEAFTEYVKKGIDLVTPPLKDLYKNAIVPVADFIMGSIVPAFKVFFSFLNGNDTGVDGPFREMAVAGEAARGVFATLVGYVQTQIIPAFQKVAPVLMALGQSIMTNVVPVVGKLVTIFTTQVLPVILQVRSYIQDKLVPIFITVAGIITTQVLPIVGKLAAWFIGTLLPAILKVYESVAKNLKPVFESIVQAIQTQVIPAVKALLVKFEEWRPTIQKVITVVVQIVGKILEFASAILGKVLPVVITVVAWLAVHLFGAIVKVIGVVGSIIGKFIDFGVAVYNGVNKVVGFISDMPGRISSAASGMWDGLKNSFRGAINWIISHWNNFSLKIPSIDTHIPGIGKIGGFSLDTPNIPLLAGGGIVPATPGGRLVRVAEGGRDEAIVPLPKGGGKPALGGDTFNIYEAVSAMATAMQVSRRQAALGAV